MIRVDPELLRLLRCPVSRLPLVQDGETLLSADGAQRYAVVSGIPCLLPTGATPTHAGYRSILDENKVVARDAVEHLPVNALAFVNAMLVATCGNLFRGATVFQAASCPVAMPSAFSRTDRVLDIGCNWGRWTIGGLCQGCRMIGMDIHLKALLAARELAKELAPGTKPLFVLGDARYPPFADQVFDGAFSYSVLQHFSKLHVRGILREMHRVLRTGGRALVQLPNQSGLRNRLVVARRGRSEGTEFDVRYYAIEEALGLFGREIGISQWSVDCFLGLNVHARDRHLVPWRRRWIIDLAEALRCVSNRIETLRLASDSIFISAIKVGEPARG
ncbi:MAG TPA: methyltransferase domain-containing protein [Vicinamibacterales bacterium]|jgi:SAM-dependent methyltransferase/uncharacterized protein YbaR (Trm112 family)